MPTEILATYRLQFQPGFGFREAAALASYLRDLGVSHLYCSPYLQARCGSTHGYDCVDPTRISDELGGAEEHARFCEALGRAGMGQILDVVPNHMAVGGPENAWWWDVLEKGPASEFASYFDIDWAPSDPDLHGKVMVPILGAPYRELLETDAIRLEAKDGRRVIRYAEHVLPVAAGTSVGADADAINADKDALHALLEKQHYRLVFWREARRRLNYRRFFDIHHLAGLRVEAPAVFHATHARVLDWLARRVLDGIRIDHIDGLLDPQEYLERLRHAAPGAWIVVEKILESGERLPVSWPVEGTTGYDFLNRVGGLFVDPAGEPATTAFYTEFTGQPADFAGLVRQKKHHVLNELLGSEVNRLMAILLRAVGRPPRETLESALREVIACFPVYRTYVRNGPDGVSESDIRHVTEAVESARRCRPDLPAAAFEYLRDVLLLRIDDEPARQAALGFQQLTGPAMAKGVEDTAFYCFNRFVCLNEVGGNPARFGMSVEGFHDACKETQRLWPRSMLATSTHDTKRGEDVRARLAVLSEIPQAWRDAVLRWSAMNACHRTGEYPDRNAEYLLYQTLVGAWPIDAKRMVAYMEKASREAKEHTSWTNPNDAYDSALRRFVESILSDPLFIADLQAFVEPLVTPGRVNSLAQTLLKLTSPGVPDIYQGMELWDLSLVDPDNRRLVDYAVRQRLLSEQEGLTPEAIWARIDEGVPKLHVICRALALRRRRPECFGGGGGYRPLKAEGSRSGHVVAFVRQEAVLSVVPRLVMQLGGDWADTRLTLPAGVWRNELTGDDASGIMAMAELLRRFPVALLSREGESGS